MGLRTSEPWGISGNPYGVRLPVSEPPFDQLYPEEIRWKARPDVLFFREDDLTLWFSGWVNELQGNRWMPGWPATSERGPYYSLGDPGTEDVFPAIPRHKVESDTWYSDDISHGKTCLLDSSSFDPRRYVRQVVEFRRVMGEDFMAVRLHPWDWYHRTVVQIWPWAGRGRWWTSSTVYHEGFVTRQLKIQEFDRAGGGEPRPAWLRGAWPEELVRVLEKDIDFVGTPWYVEPPADEDVEEP